MSIYRPPRAVSLTSRRRVVLAAGFALLIASLPSHGQSPRTPRIGFLWFASKDDSSTVQYLAAFRQRLAALGYVEGKNIVIEQRSADARPERLAELARELVASKVDVIVSPAVAASAAARQATSTIPIVMVNAGDPVGAGLIASLPRPGGNVTGTANLLLGGKQVELMRDLVPRATRLVVLVNPSNAGASQYIKDATAAARSFNLAVSVAEVTQPEDFPSVFATIRNLRPDGLLVMTEPLIGAHRAEVIAFAASARLPASYDSGGFVREGGLVSYGPRQIEHYAIAASYVDSILKGAKPADLPVQQPMSFDLLVNMKTAKALRLAVPQSVLQRAVEVVYE